VPSQLAILERAFRGLVEEQYAHILWTCEGMKALGAPLDVLLRGNAVLYAVRGPTPPAERIAGIDLPQAPLDHAVARLLRRGARVLVDDADCRRLGLGRDALVEGVEIVTEGDLPALVAAHDHVWYW
jgi:predicted peroxiredoxin